MATLVVCLQEEEEAEEEEEADKDGRSLRDSIASIKWLREREGTAWGGSSAADPIKQQKLQQAASIKRFVAMMDITGVLPCWAARSKSMIPPSWPGWVDCLQSDTPKTACSAVAVVCFRAGVCLRLRSCCLKACLVSKAAALRQALTGQQNS